jgi:CRP-like cAMP-binding protein
MPGDIHTQDGVERVVGHGTAGAFLGEVSVLTGAPQSATARAITHVRAFRISGDDVRSIVKKYRKVVSRLESTI